MKDAQAFLALFDRYNRVARLYPALLAVLPAYWTIVVLNPTAIVHVWPVGVGGGLASCVVLFLLANVARSRGKGVEQHLLAAWGGWPSTVLLRHRDPTIDEFTKGRYHAGLSALCGVTFPTRAEEAADPARADALYRSATKRLIEQSRDSKHSLLHKENAQYGFRRNLLGLKWIGVLIAGTSLALVLRHLILVVVSAQGVAFARAVAERPEVDAAAAANAIALGVWLAVVRQPFVRQAADEYALSLFRTLDA